ncbi:YjgP/YjgQ family permease [Euhalothece natronophila Z-M001]|uniref:YjgP/YjgQ family permease n=1 Tax=Euhalothece natronophila Z-M001 TaxID=522448 RepID=A0A5B8NJC8_9CHRO|nr:LptF/LptG family permease [Euhalothece natronophila]QDZ39067.1 YjgP/YjgQ family permease [Euhalothece natronophila Z-M001]
MFINKAKIIPILDIYLIQQLIPPFLFGVGAFTSIGVSVGTVFELVRRVAESGLPLTVAARVFLLSMPEFIVLAFPMATLLATLMTYSRLSSDSEIIALRSVGISIYRLVIPALMMSLFITGMTFAFNELLVPTANYEARITLEQALENDTPPFRERNILYTDYGNVEQPDGSEEEVLKRLFYAEQFDGEQMRQITVIERSRGAISQIINAQSATWNPSINKWDFYEGTSYIIGSDSSYNNVVRFEHKELNLPRTPLDLTQESRDYGEMNIAQSLEQLELVKATSDEEEVQKLKVRIQQKGSLPFVCLVFGLVGAALGTSPKNTGRATSFGISVLIIFGYYLLSFITGAMGQLGFLSPFMSAWIPNFLGLGIGGWLLFRAAN